MSDALNPNPHLPVVSTFWHGGPLPLWSRFCLESFVSVGHTMQVFTFDDTLELPGGVTRRDASQILPETSVFHYSRGKWLGSVSGFSNAFRYKMLSKIGGYWVDADVVCLRPFPIFDRATVSWEDDRRVNGAVIFAPPGDRLMADAYETSSALGESIVWGQTGPVLLTEFAKSGRYELDVLEARTFYPLHWKQIVPRLLLPSHAILAAEKCTGSMGIHLYNEIFRRFRISTNRLPPHGSYLDRLMKSSDGIRADRMSPAEVRRRYLTYYARRAPKKLSELASRRLAWPHGERRSSS